MCFVTHKTKMRRTLEKTSGFVTFFSVCLCVGCGCFARDVVFCFKFFEKAVLTVGWMVMDGFKLDGFACWCGASVWRCGCGIAVFRRVLGGWGCFGSDSIKERIHLSVGGVESEIDRRLSHENGNRNKREGRDGDDVDRTVVAKRVLLAGGQAAVNDIEGAAQPEEKDKEEEHGSIDHVEALRSQHQTPFDVDRNAQKDKLRFLSFL